MRNTSVAFRKAVYEEGKPYQCRAVISLLNNVTLELDNSKIMLGGIEWSDAITSDNAFDALGSVIINSLSITIDNSNDTYSEYDFRGSQIVLYIGVEDVQEIRIGTYIIDETSYTGFSIVLYCLDNISKLDKPYSDSTLVYPATLQTIVLDICTVCNIQLNSNYSVFPHYSYSIAERPTDSAITCREILSYIATICGCFVDCDADGKLRIKWFDTQSLNTANLDGGIFDALTPYYTGDSISGGSFSPWDTGGVADDGTFASAANINYIYAIASQSIAIEDVTVGGIKIKIPNTDPSVESAYIEYTAGNGPYWLTIENNPLINATNASVILAWLSSELIGLTFRPLTVSHLSDIAIEAGDSAIVIDRKNNTYKTLITSVLFKLNSYQTSKCCTEPVAKKASVRYSQEEKNYTVTKAMLESVNAVASQAYQVATQIDTTAVTNVVVEYAKSTSSSTAPTTGWSSDSPVWEAGKYIWQRTKTTIDGEDHISNVSCIQGAKGETGNDGTSVTILGEYETEADLRAAHPTGNAGDAYLVAGDLYVWSGSDWVNVGTIQGPQGPQGVQGPQGTSLTNITEYYSRNNTTTAPSDATFNTTVLTPTASLRYVWNYELMTYSNGNTSRTDKHIIAVYGDKGDKGDTGKALTGVTEYYCRSTSNTIVPSDSSFSTNVTVPTATYKYVWNYEVLTWDDNGTTSTTRTDKHIIAMWGEQGLPGQQGETGVGIDSYVAEYYLSVTSGSVPSGGYWSTTPQAYVEGRFYFTRTKVTYTDGYVSYAPSENGVLDNALTDANTAALQALRVAGDAEDIAEATQQYFWTDSDGVHIASQPDTPNATRNTLWNSLGMLFRKGINIILAITTGTNPSIDFYDGQGNNSSNVIATFGGSSARIGKEGAAHTTINSDGLKVFAGNGTIQIAQLGYGSVTTEYGDTENQNYFTFGTRLNNNIGGFSTVAGSKCTASASSSVASGIECVANSMGAHAEGYNTTAGHDPNTVTSNGTGAHAEGYYTRAYGDGAHASGYYTTAQSDYQTAIGKNNIIDNAGTYAFIIGNGSRYTRSNALTVDWNGNVAARAYNNISDVRLKKNIEDTDVNALDTINAIRMRQFDWLHTDEHEAIGVIADELEKIDPAFTSGGGYNKDGSINTKTVNQTYLINYLIKAVQELSAEVEMLRKEIDE